MKTILLIEDNKDILENFTEYLEMQGYKILTADNGKSGIELARQHIPDLIICDTLMPEMNGYEVFLAITEMAETDDIPFIFSTSNSENIDKAKALDLGADDYIIKPFEMESLMLMIEKWIL